MKSLLLIAVATLALTTATMAQVPNYVPTNGLVGWWPFNGNANDESGNNNNGMINGAMLTADRFGNSGKAYSFDGNDWIELTQLAAIDNSNELSISIWVKSTGTNQNTNCILGCAQHYFSRGIDGGNGFLLWTSQGNNPQFVCGINGEFSGGVQIADPNITSIPHSQWNHLLMNYDGTFIKFYVNGQMVVNTPYTINVGIGNTTNATFGRQFIGGFDYFAVGNIDDAAIYNRALTQQEITDLYNAVNCANNTAITPQTNSVTTGSTATFTATTSDPSPAYVWQSNFGQGFQTLNNVGNYSGTNTGTLNIANVQLPNHTQPIRVISTSGNCIDTSNVAVINILDTCITSTTVYDTLLTTVTDTLVINATLTGLNPPVNQNTLKVFPNPAKTHITIDYGNVSLMSGYTLKIVNALGQTVFTTPINQQTSYINLSTWTGNGIYYVQLINPQNNTIENRKIVIQ